MTPDLIALVIVAALPYADRALDKHFADRKDKRAKQATERDAQRKHELAKAGDQG